MFWTVIPVLPHALSIVIQFVALAWELQFIA
jgi:hypothetical protein